MRYSKLSLLVPCALLLSACTTVTPAYKDNGTRSGSCVEGGPDSVAQQFYDYRIQHRNNDITPLRPYLSDNLAKLLNDAPVITRIAICLTAIRSLVALRYRTVPASPAHRPFRIVMHATFRCA